MCVMFNYVMSDAWFHFTQDVASSTYSHLAAFMLAMYITNERGATSTKPRVSMNLVLFIFNSHSQNFTLN